MYIYTERLLMIYKSSRNRIICPFASYDLYIFSDDRGGLRGLAGHSLPGIRRGCHGAGLHAERNPELRRRRHVLRESRLVPVSAIERFAAKNRTAQSGLRRGRSPGRNNEQTRGTGGELYLPGHRQDDLPTDRQDEEPQVEVHR